MGSSQFNPNGWKESGHLKFRRGFFARKHMETLSVAERWVFVVLCGQAEWRGATAGLVKIESQRKFADAAGVNRRTLAAALERLERLGYITPAGPEGSWIVSKY